MGGLEFEEVSKTLARPLSRRQAMKLFAGTTAVSMVGLVGVRPAEAREPGRCRKNNAVCRSHYECCSFFCEPATGRCACPPGSQECGPRGRKTCVDCGAGTVDPQTCACICGPGTVQCGNTCCDADTECCAQGYYGDYQFCARQGSYACPQ